MASSSLEQDVARHQLKDLSDMKSLYKSLSKQQIWELKALINETEFRFDIVANLPTEVRLFETSFFLHSPRTEPKGDFENIRYIIKNSIIMRPGDIST